MAFSGIVVCAVFLLLLLLPIFGAWWLYILIFAVLLCCCAVSVFLGRKGHLRPAGYLFLFALSLSIWGVVLGGILDQGVFGFVVYFFPLPVLAAGMILGPRATFGFATVNAALIVILALVAYVALPMDTDDYGNSVLAVAIPALILSIAVSAASRTVEWTFCISSVGGPTTPTRVMSVLYPSIEHPQSINTTSPFFSFLSPGEACGRALFSPN